MSFEFTPAARRAITAAAGWTGAADDVRWGLPELLLGLLAESECRAATLLSAHGIDEQAVCGRWPGLRPIPGENVELDPSDHCSAAALRPVLRAAQLLLDDFPRPLSVATEHLLLGAVAADQEASRWLVERGLEAGRLSARIHELYGHQIETTPIDLDTIDETAGQAIDEATITESPAINTLEWDETIGEPRATSLTAQGTVDVGVLRIIDASTNRAREGLRVVEDYARFVLDDPFLTRELKTLRHQLRSALAGLSVVQLHSSRDTRADVGVSISLASEQQRIDPHDVAAASLKRVQEALRSLEEYGKLLDAGFALEMERLRYRTYTLEQALSIGMDSRVRLADARLYVLADGGRSESEFRRHVRLLVEGGVDVIQLRDKQMGDAELMARARILRELTTGTPTLFVMNDRPDMARLARADGVHLGQDELSLKDARAVTGPEMLIGISTHSIEQARDAVLAGANYIGVGPTFPSGTKHFDQFTGVGLLAHVSAEIRLPAFAIGGIRPNNLDAVLATGIRRVAIGGAIRDSDDPAAAIAQFRSALGRVR